MENPNIFFYFLISIALSFVSYFVGHIMLLFSNKKTEGDINKLFKKIVLGLLLIIIIYAIVITKAHTVLLGVIPLLLLSISFTNKRLNIENVSLKVSWLAVIVFTLFLFVITLLSFLSMADFAGNIFEQNRDYSFYSILSHYINTTGIETTNIDFYNKEFQSHSLYHWADIWLCSIVSHFSSSYYYSLTLIVFPLLASVSFVGIGAVLEKYFSLKQWTKILAMCVLPLLSIISYSYYMRDSLTLINIVKFNALLLQKMYIIIIAICFALLSKRPFIVIFITSLLFNTIFPPVIIGYVIYLIFNIRRKEKLFSKDTIAFILTIVFFYLFYFVLKQRDVLVTSGRGMSDTFFKGINQYGTESIFEYFLVPLFDFIVNTILYALLMLFVIKKEKATIIKTFKEHSYLLIIIISSVLFYAPLWFIRDSIQVYYCIAYPIFTVVNTLIIVYVWQKGNIVARIFICVILLFNILISPKSFDIKKLDKLFYSEISTLPKGNFAYIDTKSLLSNDVFERDANYHYPLPDVVRYRKDYHPVRLDVYDIAYDLSDVREFSVVNSLEKSSFYRYCQKNKLSNNIALAQMSFIKQNNIRYLIMSKEDAQKFLKRVPLSIKRVIESNQEQKAVYEIEY